MMRFPCWFHHAFSSATCSCSSRSRGIAQLLGDRGDDVADRHVARCFGGEVLDLDNVAAEFVFACDDRKAKALAVGIGELIAEPRLLEVDLGVRSEERRVGKESRCGWSL